MRLRRDLLVKWEHANERSYLYAGPGRGADCASWKQAARAEAACTIGGHHAMVLLDLLKAFENISHIILLREAQALQYPLAILRLALATYRLARTIRIGAAVSALLQATIGITAGSAMATTEMRLTLIRPVGRALCLYKAVIPTVFVDDISSESMHKSKDRLCHQLIGFNMSLCSALTEDGHIISKAKSICCASSPDLGGVIRDGLKTWGVRLQLRVVSLGAALGSGARRNAKEANKRLSSFSKRRSRFRALSKAGINIPHLLRTGGVAAITYGAEVLGVSNSMLRRQRQVAASTCTITKGSAGQNLDLALAVVDAVGKGSADPAYDAHYKPICMWARAIYDQWLSARVAERYLSEVRADLLLATVPWAKANGPAAGFTLSVLRLGWTIHSSRSVTTDNGTALRFDLDPPVVVKKAVFESVSRWRTKRALFSLDIQPPPSSTGLILWKPVLALLNKPRSEDGWLPCHQAALASAIAGRQYSQRRRFLAGWTSHVPLLLQGPFC